MNKNSCEREALSSTVQNGHLMYHDFGNKKISIYSFVNPLTDATPPNNFKTNNLAVGILWIDNNFESLSG